MPVLRQHQRNRIRSGKENPDRILERAGLSSVPRPAGKVVWFHGASVGEALAALSVIEGILAERADTWVLLTTGTVTSAKILEARLPERTIHQFAPLDRPTWVKAFLNHWQPDAAVWVESEFWPNTLWAIHDRGIPLILLNGRVSLRSFRRWLRVPAIARGLLSCFNLCLAQSDEDAQRLQTLGARTVKNTGNIKLGAPPLPYDCNQLDQLQTIIGDRPRWLLSSTHAGEEAMAGTIHAFLSQTIPNLLTIIVPRHPDRGDAISDMLRQQGLIVAQRSAHQAVAPDTQIYVADTIGELGLFYRLCQIVFMGKSLVSPGGGQNPFEAARIGCAVIFGPQMSNFVELSATMLAAKAATQVANADELGKLVEQQIMDQQIVAKNVYNAQVFCAQSDRVVADSVREILAVWPAS
ncbi:MAG: 3-deoxy-D-manno-octulosonic acid transferase [Rhodospirillales bacterium]|nr:3-deoxy-D-manno-octulosonic acid transferase [Rhodospirillales bacterium]MBT6109351.1 3-deoxy-D-manno-octulosonic acid transferase [Rhodospirillales bacterium]MBT6825778.1 3-deoxy-D-manno-octulosonic acid transferase [Rhodospirillales bacterium]MBT7506391.1 3-deoxy-D-manno-octulosonic acid transferase [Rhodospirillales bacterium]